MQTLVLEPGLTSSCPVFRHILEKIVDTLARIYRRGNGSGKRTLVAARPRKYSELAKSSSRKLGVVFRDITRSQQRGTTSTLAGQRP